MEKAQLSKIADRLELIADEILILDDAGFEAAVKIFNQHSNATSLYEDGKIFLRKSRGEHILEDIAHEGTHSLDFSSAGIFKGMEGETNDARRSLPS